MEPHVGDGAFVPPILAAGAQLHCNDLSLLASGLQLGHTSSVTNFLAFWDTRDWTWILGNPPFARPETEEHDGLSPETGRRNSKGALVLEDAAEDHVRHALKLTHDNVAFLLRLAFLESDKRIAFWKEHPAYKVWPLAHRPSFTADGKTDNAAYGWFWWSKSRAEFTAQHGTLLGAPIAWKSKKAKSCPAGSGT